MNSEILVFDKERDMKAGKLFRLVMVSAVLLLMMLETGCVFRGGRDKSSSLDLQEINKRIEKKGAGSAVLEAETADAEKRVKVREITHSLSAKDHIVPAEIAGDLSAAGSQLLIEHPSGAMAVDIEVEHSQDGIKLKRSGFVRTARKLYEGQVFISE